MHNIQEAAEIRKKKVRTLVTIIVISVIAIIGISLTGILREISYQRAVDAFARADYSTSISYFEKVAGYKDADDILQEAHYNLGVIYLDDGDNDSALDEFDAAGEFSDAPTLAKESLYRRGIAYMQSGNYQLAQTDLERVGDYRDASNQVVECKYQQGMSRLDNSTANTPSFDYISASNGDSDAYSGHPILDTLPYLAAGDTVAFGCYDQDGNPGNGSEPIEWQILAKDDKSATLISKYGLDTLPYDREVDFSTWETCELRRWLNNDFYQQAFTTDEQECLETVNVPADRNPEYNTDPGNMVQDKVYVLSIEEANWLFGSDEERMCTPTETALLNGATPDDFGTCWWWLRSPGGEPNRTGIVDYYGPVWYNGFAVFVDGVTVRPVIVVRL